ncbi:SGNH/GDSL hydrolase family protein [Legionella dresdenensis]|uniref:SGNH/GDSL hydrolase family protein n=1 Tax=Legionella dresdenensis TaxID=450200 RepID=A0ABV8CFF0_9GAMM
MAVQNSSQSIGPGYPTTTGRLKQVLTAHPGVAVKVALVGDSTEDNGHWVQRDLPYHQKTHTVTHQAAVNLDELQAGNYEVACFAVDGATTDSLGENYRLNSVLPRGDEDHTSNEVHQLNAVAAWQPDVVVLSVGGNNYRGALYGTLTKALNYFQLLTRSTPEADKPKIKAVFEWVHETLLVEYKAIIDSLITNNPNLKRIVLLSQYYPALTEFTSYFIYTGFAHVARANGSNQDGFTALQETMNGLYRELLSYAASKNKEIVFADMTSSMNPLGGNHIAQIEPNENGSEIMGKMIANAVAYTFPTTESVQGQKSISMLRLSTDEKLVESTLLSENEIRQFKVKELKQFIRENRYRHASLFFAPKSTLLTRFESGYHLIMGKQFDHQYSGVFAFGLLDLTIVPVLAHYLWRVAIHENVPAALKIAAGALAAPVLLAKIITGLALMIALALPVYGFHKAVNWAVRQPDEQDNNLLGFTDNHQQIDEHAQDNSGVLGFTAQPTLS